MEITKPLGIEENRKEYWGPVSKDFTDAYLDALYDDIRSSQIAEKRSHKKVFSALTELLHNVTNYNIDNFLDDIPPSYVSLEFLNKTAVLRCYNVVLESSVSEIQNIFGKLASIPKLGYDHIYRKKLLQQESLGLLLLNRNEGTGFHWEFCKENGKNWLKIIITVNYGCIDN